MTLLVHTSVGVGGQPTDECTKRGAGGAPESSGSAAVWVGRAHTATHLGVQALLRDALL